MARKKRGAATKEKKKRVHRPNKAKLWEVKDGIVVRTNRECPRCGKGVYLAAHYSRMSCGRCGYTKFNTPKSTKKAVTTVGGVKTVRRRRKQLQK